ncbi:MAG: LysR family transcriptional regulator [Pseudomonadota bacterium]
MIPASPHLPSLDNLQVFEVAARHSSFKLAATELNVTPAAIGQRIRKLEAQLGTELFERRVREIRLTGPGKELFDAVQEALGLIEIGLAKSKRRDSKKVLIINTTPVFADRWLLNHLKDFKRQFPHINVQVIADAQCSNFAGITPEIAIRFGLGRASNCSLTALVDDEYIPVCNEDIANILTNPKSKKKGTEIPLIHCDWLSAGGSAPSWKQWLDKFSTNVKIDVTGLSVSLESLAIQAALTGQGIALVHRLHVKNELSTGALINPFPADWTLTPSLRYYFVEPDKHKEQPAVVSFKAWLMDRIA